MVETNPYSAPRAQVRDPLNVAGRTELATPWIRLGAVMLDTLIPFSIAFVIGFTVAFTSEDEQFPVYGLVLMGVFGLGYFLYQLKLLAENGWTLGKKICGIKIVRFDGNEAAVGRIVGLRMLVPGLLGAIPIAGFVFAFVDALFIFSEQNRTLHDRIADTLVVVA
jgi:uncharacterized RDD family membrane protein YckC